jgi:3-oxoacyl-(acyl-carrier-protein) synthase
MKCLLLFMTDLLDASSGDVVEARAIQAVFKEHASSGSLAFSSTKVWP